MTKLAVVLGAGWKPFNDWKLSQNPHLAKLVPPRTPELLWPLPDGHTVLSRYVAQLTSLGVESVLACVGVPGCSPREIEDAHARFGPARGAYGKSPWTEEREELVYDAGAMALCINDPMGTKKSGHWRTCWDTLIEAMEVLDMLCWDSVITLAGDYCLRTSYLEKVVNEPSRCQYWLLPKHSVEHFDRHHLNLFLTYLGTQRPNLSQSKVWGNRQSLAAYGVKVIEEWQFPPKSLPPGEERTAMVAERRHHFCEIGPAEYPFARRLAQEDPI